MFRRHWRQIGYAIPFGLAAVVVLGASAHDALNRPSAYGGATQQYGSTAESPQMGASPHPVANTPERNNQPERDQWRQEEDLRAQQDMARWAFLLLLVTTVGVIYVARTLNATKKASEAAQTAADATVKANEGFAESSQ